MRILKFWLLLISSIALVVSAIYCELNAISVGSMLCSLFAGITIPCIKNSAEDFADNTNWKASQRKLMRAGYLKKGTQVRISFAYLFRIKIDGKYFLVQNPRTKKYQPVGGAYKFSKSEADYLSANIPVESDDRIPVSQITERDYRLLVKNKDLRRFVKRFNTTQYRENVLDLSREFIEELFSTNIFDRNQFGELSYKYCGRHYTNVEYGAVFRHYELLLADIVEVQLSEAQKNLFRNLTKEKSNRFRFATADEIKSLGVSIGTDELQDEIANHSYKILSENADKLEIEKGYKDYKDTITVHL